MYIDQVAEFQGLYGPFTLSERVLQRIWLRRDFASTGMKTASGKELFIKDPGRWNVVEGPDFKEARLILDGAELIGDVEVHLNLQDWCHHQHESDQNYNRVLLHVVLHLDKANQPSQVQTSRGDTPELLHLLPLLEQDLESYAMEDALLELEQQDELEWIAHFAGQPLKEKKLLLEQQALRRWQQKLAYGKQRLETEGWEAACHSYMLEVLGYRRNRAPMLRLAAQFPLPKMRSALINPRTVNMGHRTLNMEGQMVDSYRRSGGSEQVNAALVADRLFDEELLHWKLNGLRPANHPRKRLRQYLEVVAKQPHWPVRLADCLKHVPAAVMQSETAAFRRAVGLSALRAELRESVFCSVISEKRLNTLVVDAIIPLATVAGLLNGFEYWLHWFAGDSPDVLLRFLRQTDVVNRPNPLSNGLIQGALGLSLDHGR